MKKKVNVKLIILLAVIAIVVVLIIVKKIKDSKFEAEVEAEQKRIAEQQKADKNNKNNNNSPTATPTEEQKTVEEAAVDKLQAELTARYGECPEGFKWTRQGKMVATGSSEYTSEEVLYIYFRGLSMQDFTVVQRYSNASTIVARYRSMREKSKNTSYAQFLARQFTAALANLQMESDNDVAIFADGVEYHNVEYSTLDFKDKNFYLKDRATLFEQLAEIYRVEKDYTKVQDALFEYVLEQYKSGSFPRRTSMIEIRVEPADEGYLVADDDAFCEQLLYDNGIDAIQYILDDFSEYAKAYFSEYSDYGNINRFYTVPDDDDDDWDEDDFIPAKD